MKKGFPHKNIFGFPKGWKDLGEVESYNGKKENLVIDIHSFCKTILNIGKENNKFFKFCPRCMVKTEK